MADDFPLDYLKRIIDKLVVMQNMLIEFRQTMSKDDTASLAVWQNASDRQMESFMWLNFLYKAHKDSKIDDL